MDLVAILMEEYKTVRQESLDAIARIQVVAQYSLATAGVALGVSFLAAQSDPIAAAVVLMLITPLAAAFGGAVLAAEVARVARAGEHLRTIEKRVSDAFPGTSPPLSWETNLARSRRGSAYRLAIGVVLVTAVVYGPVLGGYLLAREHDYWELGAGLLIDATFLLLLARTALRTFDDAARRLHQP